MLVIRKFLLLSVLFLFSSGLATAKEHHSSHFKLSDFEGSYIASGLTPGSSNTDGSATIFTFKMDRDGTGEIIFLSERFNVGTVFPGAPTSPVVRFAHLPVTVTLNPDGTGQFITHDFPAPGDTVITDMVVKKDRCNRITGGFLLKVGTTGPTVNPVSAEEVKLFTFERQF